MKRIIVALAITLFCSSAFAAEKKSAKPAKEPAKTAAPAKAVGACDDATTKGACREYTAFGFRTEKDEKEMCEKMGGKWKSKEGCPTEKLLGSCAEENGEIQKWYDAGGNKGSKAAVVKDACDAMGGKFTAP